MMLQAVHVVSPQTPLAHWIYTGCLNTAGFNHHNFLPCYHNYPVPFYTTTLSVHINKVELQTVSVR